MLNTREATQTTAPNHSITIDINFWNGLLLSNFTESIELALTEMFKNRAVQLP